MACKLKKIVCIFKSFFVHIPFNLATTNSKPYTLYSIVLVEYIFYAKSADSKQKQTLWFPSKSGLSKLFLITQNPFSFKTDAARRYLQGNK